MLFQKISDICSQKGLSVSELERRCGFANAAIRKWKTSSPSADNLAKVADVLEVSVDCLLGRACVEAVESE